MDELGCGRVCGGEYHKDRLVVTVDAGGLSQGYSGRGVHLRRPAFELQPAKLQWREAEAALQRVQMHVAVCSLQFCG